MFFGLFLPVSYNLLGLECWVYALKETVLGCQLIGFQNCDKRLFTFCTFKILECSTPSNEFLYFRNFFGSLCKQVDNFYNTRRTKMMQFENIRISIPDNTWQFQKTNIKNNAQRTWNPKFVSCFDALIKKITTHLRISGRELYVQPLA